MKFDIARQPLVPAFLTLLAFALAAMWSMASRPEPRTGSASDGRAPIHLLQTEHSSGPAGNGTADGSRTTESPHSPSAGSAGRPAPLRTGGTSFSETAGEHSDHGTAAERSVGAPHRVPAEDRFAEYPTETPAAAPSNRNTARSLPGLRSGANTDASGRLSAPTAPAAAEANDTARSEVMILPGIEAPASGRLSEPAPIRTFPTGIPEKTDTLRPRTAPPAPARLISAFQTDHPETARLLACFMLLFAGMCTGRMTIRYNLYAVSTCLAIPLYAIAACGIRIGDDYLAGFAASMLLALSVKNFGRAFRNGYGFDGIFRAALYLGTLPLILPATLPLWLLLPLALLLFRRTFREAIVATAGLLLPLLATSYIGWSLGEPFSAPAQALAEVFTAGRYFTLFAGISLPAAIMGGSVLLLALPAVALFLSDAYAAGSKPRFMLIFDIAVFLLTVAALILPSASEALFPLLAVPWAVLLPVLFVRIDRAISAPLYLLLLASAAASLVMQ